VTKFNLPNFIKNVGWALIVLFAFLLWLCQDPLSTSNNISTRRFCAYGQVYVEFESKSKIWGTTFLNDRGRPVSCTEDDILQENVTHKEVI